MEEDFADKYPHRPKEHVIGDRALSLFLERKKAEWAWQEPRVDYGWDVFITIVEKETVREDFFVQIKGHKNPNYIENGKFISEQFKVSTLRWLTEKPNPTLICVCHVNATSEPIYYVWLSDALEEIYKTNPTWEKHEYITLRIPTNNLFDKGSCDKIEEDVKDLYTSLGIKKIIGDILAPDLPSETLKSYRGRSPSYVMENVAPILRDSGIVDIIDEKDIKRIEPLSKLDQELSKTLSEASAFLKTFTDSEALKILKTLESKIENSSDGIKAKYFNSRGVLALHSKNDTDALEWFEKAYALRPKEPKIATNYLLAHFHLLTIKKKTKLPDDFSLKLEEIISNNPEFLPAMRLKACYLAETASVSDARKFLETSSVLEKEPLLTHICLAEIYEDSGRLNDAIEIMKQIESKGIVADESFYSFYAFLLFQKAISNISSDRKFIIHGSGPSNLNIELLKSSLNYYERAYKIIASKSFPVVFEDSIVNYAIALGLLEDHQGAEAICRAYLDIHPDSINVNGSLAASLFKQGKFHHSLRYGKIAFSGEPSSTTFINLTLTL
jgi:tetratricopeptide (TPR) repeat protein